jgi:hypothetical protein
VSAWIAGAFSVIVWSRRFRLWLGRCVFMLLLDSVLFCWDFSHLSGLGGRYMMLYFDHGMCMLEIYDFYPLQLLRRFIYACLLDFCWDVASISWIYLLFTCFIALIEIGRYNYRLYVDELVDTSHLRKSGYIGWVYMPWLLQVRSKIKNIMWRCVVVASWQEYTYNIKCEYVPILVFCMISKLCSYEMMKLKDILHTSVQ